MFFMEIEDETLELMDKLGKLFLYGEYCTVEVDTDTMQAEIV